MGTAIEIGEKLGGEWRVPPVPQAIHPGWIRQLHWHYGPDKGALAFIIGEICPLSRQGYHI